MKDTIYRADAIEAVKETKPIVRSTERNWGKMIADEHSKELVKAIKAIPSAESPNLKQEFESAEAVQGYTEWLEKIIVMLEPEYLCEDTTDEEWCEKNCKYDSIQAECLRHLYGTNKSAPAEAVGWIPCSERLPNVGEDVLFCDAKWTEEGCLRADGDWWQFRWSTVMPKEKVIAWMPLPKPYKGGAE